MWGRIYVTTVNIHECKEPNYMEKGHPGCMLRGEGGRSGLDCWERRERRGAWGRFAMLGSWRWGALWPPAVHRVQLAVQLLQQRRHDLQGLHKVGTSNSRRCCCRDATEDPEGHESCCSPAGEYNFIHRTQSCELRGTAPACAHFPECHADIPVAASCGRESKRDLGCKIRQFFSCIASL